MSPAACARCTASTSSTGSTVARVRLSCSPPIAHVGERRCGILLPGAIVWQEKRQSAPNAACANERSPPHRPRSRARDKDQHVHFGRWVYGPLLIGPLIQLTPVLKQVSDSMFLHPAPVARFCTRALRMARARQGHQADEYLDLERPRVLDRLRHREGCSSCASSRGPYEPIPYYSLAQCIFSPGVRRRIWLQSRSRVRVNVLFGDTLTRRRVLYKLARLRSIFAHTPGHIAVDSTWACCPPCVSTWVPD
jgi:hypothetical protein